MRITTTVFGTFALVVGAIGLVLALGVHVDVRIAVVCGLLAVALALVVSAFWTTPGGQSQDVEQDLDAPASDSYNKKRTDSQ